MSKRHFLGTITKEVQKLGYMGVGKCECCGATKPRYYLRDALGQALPQDIGKQVYIVDGIIQVENSEQIAKRLKRRRK